MMFSRHQDLQKNIRAIGLSGELVDQSLVRAADSLLITHANLGGSKSDRYVKTRADLESTVDRSGKMVNKLTITRANTMPDYFINNLNDDYMRIYVPLGSRLLESDQPVDTYTELGRTVFALRMRIASKEQKSVTIIYQLPTLDSERNSISFFLERSPGQVIDSFSYKVALPKEAEILNTIGVSQASSEDNMLELNRSFVTSDTFWGLVYSL